MNKRLRELAYEFDDSLGRLSQNIESIHAIEIELSRIREKVDNLDSGNVISVAHLSDMYYKIIMINDLLSYAKKDLIKHHEISNRISKAFFDIVVRQ